MLVWVRLSFKGRLISTLKSFTNQLENKDYQNAPTSKIKLNLKVTELRGCK